MNLMRTSILSVYKTNTFLMNLRKYENKFLKIAPLENSSLEKHQNSHFRETYYRYSY